jgi:hypothetical protein
LLVFNSSNEDLVSNVDAKSVIFIFSELFLVIQVEKVNSSASVSFSSSFLVLEDLNTLIFTFVIFSLELRLMSVGNEDKCGS